MSKAPWWLHAIYLALLSLISYQVTPGPVAPKPTPTPPPIVKPDPKPVPTPPPVVDPVSARLLSAFNAERSKVGLAPVLPDARLTATSAYWANMLHATNTLTHGVGTNSPKSRLTEAGFPDSGEVAAMADTLDECVRCLINHPPHRVIILDPHYTIAGGSQSGNKWVIDFAK